MGTLVATADATTGTVRIDVDQTVVYDFFSRVVANGWGSPPRGNAWTTSGGPAANYNVNGSFGNHIHTTIALDRTSAMVVGATDFDMMVTVGYSAPPAGAAWQMTLIGRLGNAGADYVALNMIGNVGGAVQLSLEFSQGSGVILGPTVTAGGVTSSQTMTFRFQACGNTIRASVWDATAPPIAAWMTTLQVPTVFAGDIQMNTFLQPGNTNPLPYTFAFDFFSLDIGQPVRLYRVTPDGTRTEVRGSAFYTTPDAPSLATVYDNEAPFDVAITYELHSDCTMFDTITSNSVTLSSGGNGWIRDPANPGNNILLTENGAVYNDCNTLREITFLGWDPRVYANSSGIFDIINSERPNTVSMRRKRYESQFSFATKTLDDMDLMENIFMPGTILLVSLPTTYGFGRPYGQDYITVMDLEQLPSSTDDFRVPYREWTVPFKLSYAPPDLNEGMTGGNGIGGGGATYEILSESVLGTTYATLAASGETFQQVAQGVGY